MNKPLTSLISQEKKGHQSPLGAPLNLTGEYKIEPSISHLNIPPQRPTSSVVLNRRILKG